MEPPLPANSHFCSSCGAPQAAVSRPEAARVSPPPTQVPPGIPTATPPVTINFRRLGTGDIIAGVATIVVFVCLFLPWYTVGVNSPLSVSALGSLAGGWRYLILVVSLLIFVYLFVRTFLARGPRLPLPHWQLMTSMTVINALLLVLAFLVKPDFAQLLSDVGVSTSWGYGAFIGIVAGIIAVIGSVVRRNEPENLMGIRPAPQMWQPQNPPGPWVAQPPDSPPPTYIPAQPTSSSTGPPHAEVPETVMSCRNCGSTVEIGNHFCNACGAPAR